MTPPDQLVAAANLVLSDPVRRATVRDLHARQEPLSAMCDALALPLSAPIRSMLDSLAPDVAYGIRVATLAALDRGEFAMPLDCDVTEAEVDAGARTSIDFTEPGEVPTIRIRRA